jgi:flagellar biosynthesis protein FliR
VTHSSCHREREALWKSFKEAPVERQTSESKKMVKVVKTVRYAGENMTSVALPFVLGLDLT